ncbi:MAG: hypothetical protein ABS949_11160 [Solibacillus sp.]
MQEFPFNAVIENPLQTIKVQGSATKLSNANAIYKTITRPTTLYVKQREQ